jgi:hypothetical protein
MDSKSSLFFKAIVITVKLILSITKDRLAILLPATQRASLFNIVRFKFSQSGFNAIGFLFFLFTVFKFTH